jgi:hypothetical protein
MPTSEDDDMILRRVTTSRFESAQQQGLESSTFIT